MHGFHITPRQASTAPLAESAMAAFPDSSHTGDGCGPRMGSSVETLHGSPVDIL